MPNLCGQVFEIPHAPFLARFQLHYNVKREFELHWQMILQREAISILQKIFLQTPSFCHSEYQIQLFGWLIDIKPQQSHNIWVIQLPWEINKQKNSDTRWLLPPLWTASFVKRHEAACTHSIVKIIEQQLPRCGIIFSLKYRTKVP